MIPLCVHFKQQRFPSCGLHLCRLHPEKMNLTTPNTKRDYVKISKQNIRESKNPIDGRINKKRLVKIRKQKRLPRHLGCLFPSKIFIPYAKGDVLFDSSPHTAFLRRYRVLASKICPMRVLWPWERTFLYCYFLVLMLPANIMLIFTPAKLGFSMLESDILPQPSSSWPL